MARGIPVIIGEWALLNYDHNRLGVIEQGEFLKFLEAVGYHARNRRVTTMIWDAGQFLNRNEQRWRDQGIHDMIRASWTTRSGTASSDQLYVPRSSAITSRTLALHLNGLSFQGLRQGGTNLVNGSDYTVSGNAVTLTPSLLTRLVGNRLRRERHDRSAVLRRRAVADQHHHVRPADPVGRERLDELVRDPDPAPRRPGRDDGG